MKSKGKAQSFKRRAARRTARTHFYLFTEGQNTERDYFEAIQKAFGSELVKVVQRGALGVPSTVASKAVEFAQEMGLGGRRRRRRLNSFEENDEVWAIFDRDEFTCYHEAKQMCSGAGIGYAYSDPCFELWLNLHFSDQDAPCTRHDAQNKTKQLVAEYDPSCGKTADFTCLVNALEEAEIRAEKQRIRRREEANEDGNPSTNIYKLTRRIRARSEKPD